MESLIILVYDQDRKLVQKPADYKALLEIARDKFLDLDCASNDEITFHFIPKWFENEVELDGSSFADVYDRAILRITTTAPASATHPDGDDIEIQDNSFGVVGPMPMFSGALPPLGWMRVRVFYVPTEQIVSYHIKAFTKMEKLMAKTAIDFGFCLDECCFFYEDEVIGDDYTPGSLGMEPNELIELRAV